ncbi:HhH-GPD superfamily base excision DNA repair protein [Colletotrichum navitas]|uniref:Endonuclease III homolog n=1 Tax=Colletotrichum navitas TaxID=681940 RepID=A0AAD8PUD5_9PEZI|nr:HhH-GPD superfamily base excision DNA repair protein [Colletotrichum navitas]KAK1580407.1 HhH-GPD superfamily base excision DNA repair protein [Colletotrichum navitas]
MARPSSPLPTTTTTTTTTTTAPSPPQQTRRTTRSSLARFAYNAGVSSITDANAAAAETVHDIVLGVTDIEDAVVNTRGRKRRRVTKVEDGQDAYAENGIANIKVEHVETETTAATAAARASPSQTRKARKPARVIKGTNAVESHTEPPSDWESIYDAVKRMRLHGAARNAAVDTMGCERLFHPDASERDRRYHILTALMLSSQTKDTVNAVAMKRLMMELPPHEPGAAGGLNLENVLAVDPAFLNELIWAVGFHNNKTKYIKAAAEILRDRFNGDIPDTIEGLTSLPGVGPKMAYLCLSAAWDRTEGIGVDVHVHRITNLWGWHKTTQPEATRLALQSWLPKDKWREINWLLVGFGQTVCLPVGRKCGECDLGLSGMCKAAERKKVNEGRRMREVKVEVKGQGDGSVVIKKEEVVKEEEVEQDRVINETVGVSESGPEAGVDDSSQQQPEEDATAGKADRAAVTWRLRRGKPS